jgi:5-methylcytosine-specific restriction endonuclease McrA
MVVNKAKLEGYASKVYRGDLRRYKEKQKTDISYTFDLFYKEESKSIKGERVATNSSQGKMVIEKCRRKCIICGKKYDEDPVDFQIHHVNGDRTKTITDNLVLLCHSCHKKIHDSASAKLKDYKVKSKSASSKKSQSPFAIPSFKQPKYDIPSFDSPFDLGPKKKSRKKKK